MRIQNSEDNQHALSEKGAVGIRGVVRVVSPLFFYLLATAIVEGILSMLFVLFVRAAVTETATEGITPFLAKNAYWLLAAGSGVLLPVFFLRQYREDWKLRVAVRADGKLHFAERESGVQKEKLLSKWRRIPQKGLLLLTSFAAALALTALVNLIGAVVPQALHGAAEVNAAMQETSLTVILIVTVLIVPFFEELIFRGLLYRRMRDYLGFWTSAALSAFCFGFLHGFAAQSLFAFGMGLFFAWVYERCNMLYAAVFVHATANAVNFVWLALQRMAAAAAYAQGTGFFGKQPQLEWIAGNSGGIALLLFLCAGAAFLKLAALLSEKLPREQYILFAKTQTEQK